MYKVSKRHLESGYFWRWGNVDSLLLTLKDCLGLLPDRMKHYEDDQTHLVGDLRCSLFLKPNYKLHLQQKPLSWSPWRVLSSTKCSWISLNIRIIKGSFSNVASFRPHLYILILHLRVGSPDICTFSKHCQVIGNIWSGRQCLKIRQRRSGSLRVCPISTSTLGRDLQTIQYSLWE